MSTPLLALAGVAWWGIGLAGFLYWWRRRFDVTVSDLIFAVITSATLGPLQWLLGWLLVSPPAIFSRVLLRKSERG